MAYLPDDDPNRIQGEYQDKFNLNDAEKTAGTNDVGDSGNPQDNIGQVKNAEENPGFINNVTGNKGAPGKSMGRLSFLKKKAPLAFIGTTVIVGGFGLVSFFSPGLLIVHFKEVMVNKFDAAHASMEVRTTRVLRSKTVSKGCTTNVPIFCKYSSMSEKQVSMFKEAEITVHGKPSPITGRIIPESFEYEKLKIPASEFPTYYDNNIKFRAAVRKGYNPKFANFFDASYVKAAKFLNVSKEPPPVDGNKTFDENLQAVGDDLAERTKAKPIPEPKLADIDPDTAKPYSQGTEEDFNKAVTKSKEQNAIIQRLIDESGAEGASTSSKITQLLEEADDWAGVKGYASVATEGVDRFCTVQRTYQAVSLSAKLFRAAQLANYAMMFLSAADMIKAGVADENTITFLGTVLTKLSLDEYGKYLSATDSFGYKYSAFGEVGTMKTSSMQFMAGGGTKGAISKLIGEVIPENGKISATCQIMGSLWVTLGSLLAGITISVLNPAVSGSKVIFMAGVKSKVKMLISKDFWVSAAKTGGIPALLGLSEIVLPNLLKDIVAGSLIDENTVGETAGDALVSGSSGIMGTTAKFGGSAVLLADQAVKYDSLKEDIAAKEAEYDRLAYSPLDATNSNTFMGKIATWLIPYTSKLSSLTGILSSISSIVTKSFAFLSPQHTNAVGVATTTEESYTQCEDIEYRNRLNIATDPYCNITYGMPGIDKDADPIETADNLLSLSYNQNHTGIDKSVQLVPIPQIDPEGVRINKYPEFVSNCIDRSWPLYLSNYNNKTIFDPTGEGKTGGKGGSECIYNDSKDIYEVQSWEEGPETCATSKPENPPTPPVGSIYLTDWQTTGETSSDGCTTFYQNYFYVGSKYLYLYYIDQRVETGMDGL